MKSLTGRQTETRVSIAIMLSLFLASSLAAQQIRPVDESILPSRIAFGSCAKQTKPQPVLRTVVQKRPDVFVYLGDNIYGDTRDMNVLQAKYDQLAAKPEFQLLRKEVMVLSIWDDHDYGENDAGKEYPKKAESREIFFDFWNVPDASQRRSHPGIYGMHEFRQGQRTLQVILLDTRTFRDPLKRLTTEGKSRGYKNDYEPDNDQQKTILWGGAMALVRAVLVEACGSASHLLFHSIWTPVQRLGKLDQSAARTAEDDLVDPQNQGEWRGFHIRGRALGRDLETRAG